MMQPYFPNDKPGQADWYANMALNFPLVAATLGFGGGETAIWVADCTYAAYLLGAFSAPVFSFSTAVTGYVNTVLTGPAGTAALPLPPRPNPWPPVPAAVAVAPGIDGRRQRTVARIKAAPGYTPLVIGHLLRTENTGAPFNPDIYVAEIRSIHLNGHGQPVIVFSKAGGHIDGVNLYCQRAGDAAPVKVGQFTHTPAVDPTPPKAPGVPEERTYTVMGVIADQEIGMPSAPVSILVK